VLVAGDDLLELGDDLAERSRELVAQSFRWRRLFPAAT